MGVLGGYNEILVLGSISTFINIMNVDIASQALC